MPSSDKRLQRAQSLLAEPVRQAHTPVPFQHVDIFIGDGFEVDESRCAAFQAEILHFHRRQVEVILSFMRIDESFDLPFWGIRFALQVEHKADASHQHSQR
jgi:hypothetical protein